MHKIVVRDVVELSLPFIDCQVSGSCQAEFYLSTSTVVLPTEDKQVLGTESPRPWQGQRADLFADNN
ncbi:hypothetical protein T05_51 [Trichinella murrelli]|uniref:Uncharacterized protein n=1 Tax=Trichinella murrelli TaxID=144512 RepID=A0A0V0UHR0_9BILA|nr:hypothetical protein T05_51 [Trichinella murrelli]